MKKVLLVGCGMQYQTMMEKLGFLVVGNVSSIKSASYVPNYDGVDIVLFGGGADVHPMMYGHEKHHTTMTSTLDDELYETAYETARQVNPDCLMVGICRGSQFLCVKAGGELIQDLRGHTGSHNAFDVLSKELFFVTSTHHQMQYPFNRLKENEDFRILGKTPRIIGSYHAMYDEKTGKFTNPFDANPNAVEVESCHYKNINALAFQPHPEFFGADDTLLMFDKHLRYVLNL